MPAASAASAVSRAGWPGLWTGLGLTLLLSLALTVYTVLMWRIALPSFDVVDYEDWLIAAADGTLDWSELWQRHNGVHVIALTKLLLVLDVWWGRGSGVLTMAVSALALLATWAVLAWRMARLPLLQPLERRLLVWLAALLFGSVFLAESLLNPINSQWSFLALGAVLLANGLHGLCNDGGRWGWPCLLSGAAIAGLSAGHPLLLAVTALVTLWLLHPRCQLWRHIVLHAVTVLAIGLLAYELLSAWWPWPPLLALIYKPLLPAAEWQDWLQTLRAGPLVHAGWLYARLDFLGQFMLVPFARHGSLGLFPALFALLALVWLVRACWRADRRLAFFVALAVLALLVGMAAASVRIWLVSYSYRHAAMGFLLVLSALVLLYGGLPRRPSPYWLAAVLWVYGACFLYKAQAEAAVWSAGGRDPGRQRQMAYALGVQDRELLRWFWKASEDTTPAQAEGRRQRLQALGIGVFASPMYRHFTGALPLPAAEVDCRHRWLAFGPATADAQVMYLKGHSRTLDGRGLRQALMFADNGQAIGYGMGVLPSDRLWAQMRLPWPWAGYLRYSDAAPAAVTVVAFDGRQRCRPVTLPWPVSAVEASHD